MQWVANGTRDRRKTANPFSLKKVFLCVCYCRHQGYCWYCSFAVCISSSIIFIHFKPNSLWPLWWWENIISLWVNMGWLWCFAIFVIRQNDFGSDCPQIKQTFAFESSSWLKPIIASASLFSISFAAPKKALSCLPKLYSLYCNAFAECELLLCLWAAFALRLSWNQIN